MSLIFCPLFSGSSGNAVLVGAGNAKVLIDAGLSGTTIESALLSLGESMREVKAILITHEHIDHIKGVGILSRKYDIPVFANAATWRAMSSKVGVIKDKNICVFEESDFYIDDLGVETIKTPHDAAMSVGYRVTYRDKSVAVMTDLGHYTKKIISFLKNTEIVLLESNHDLEMLRTSRYPKTLIKRIASEKGHLSNDSAGDAAVELVQNGVKGILLGHLSEENNDEEVAYNTVAEKLSLSGIKVGKDMALGMAFRKRTTGVFNIK